MRLLKSFSLVILNKTDESNKVLFGKNILGVSSEKWLASSLKDCFGEVLCVKDAETLKKKQAMLKHEYVACLYWDTVLVRETDLVQYCDSFLRLKRQLSLPKGFVFNRNQQFLEQTDARPSGAYLGLSAGTLPVIYEKLRKEIISTHLSNGVLVYGTDGLVIDKTVEICEGVQIYAPNIIAGKTSIGKDSRIYPNCFLENVKINGKCEIKSSYAADAEIGSGTTVGPFANLRPGTKIGKNCKIGDFVEIKNSTLGDGTKASHLAYIGDAKIGTNVNIGCGTVFVNYNGKQKFETTVGDNAFIGSNANLIAPVEIGKYGFVAAGTTVTEKVNSGDLVIGRLKPVVKEGGGIKRLT